MVKLDKYTLAGLCLTTSAKFNKKTAFSMINDGKISKNITYGQMGLFSRQIGCVLRQLDIKEGDRVLLFSENCPQWAFAYFGIALAGAVSVPVLTGFSTDQIEYIANHADVCAICVTRTMMEKIENKENITIFSKVPLIYIDSMNNGEITISHNGGEKQIALRLDNEPVLSTRPDDIATIIYTSGTSGSSKGVMLSGKNIISCAVSSVSFIRLNTRDRLLSVLPLAHSYECTIGLIVPVMSGTSITYIDKPPSPSVLLPALKLVRPTAMLSVPLLIEKIYNNAIAPKLKKSKLYNFFLTKKLVTLIIGRKLISLFGGRIRFFGVGGAPLSKEVEKFLCSARFPLALGYGLTETAPLVAARAPLGYKFNSGLNECKGVTLRIGNEGEIQVKGPNVMLGYYKDSGKTLEAFTEDGWFRTGDLGNLNKGRLTIRGRLKAVILGPSGENIYPEEIEGLLGTSQLVEDALVYSGERGELIALVRLTDAAKTAAGAISHTLEDLRLWVNKKLSAFSRLNRIDIKDEPFEKTPTMKIKRYLYN
jgi:long-chain acyl-CoA synthetase